MITTIITYVYYYSPIIKPVSTVITSLNLVLFTNISMINISQVVSTLTR